MRSISLFFAISLMALITSCTNEVEDSWAETLRVHDEVMLKMQDNSELEQKLTELIKRGNASTTSVLFTKIDTLEGALEVLAKSDEAMMDWMASIQEPHKGDDVDSTLTYHKELTISIIEIGVQMDDAALNAENILKSLEK